MLSGRTLRRMERDFLLSAPPGEISGGIHLHDFSMLCRGETLAHTKPLTRNTCHFSTMDDPYFTLCKYGVLFSCSISELRFSSLYGLDSDLNNFK